MNEGVVATLDRVAFKPIYYLYYRVLFGRHYPGCAWLARKVAAWEERHQRRDPPTSKDAWEREYDHGDWRFLQGDEEAEPYGWLVERFYGGARSRFASLSVVKRASWKTTMLPGARRSSTCRKRVSASVPAQSSAMML